MSNEHFEKQVGERLRFAGVFDGTVSMSKSMERVCFKNVYEPSTGEKFRDHVHILCSRSLYEKALAGREGDLFSFTAEIYRYTKNPHGKIFYRKRGIGLQDIQKLKREGVK